MGSIVIKNMLEVKSGNVILVPGCEPLSSTTSNTLAANSTCSAAVVDLAVALATIPGSTIIMMRNPGSSRPKGLYFVLPEGPPARWGCRDCTYIEDYYAMLREVSDDLDYEKSIVEIDINSPSRVDPDGYPVIEPCKGQVCKVFPLLL